MQLYLIWTKRMPFITFSISRTLPMDGGWIWIGGRAVFDFPVYISFIFFWRTTACDVKCRKHSDDSRVFSWDSPSYTTEYSVRIISKQRLWTEQDYMFWVHLRVQLKDPSILQFHFNYIQLHSNYNNNQRNRNFGQSPNTRHKTCSGSTCYIQPTTFGCYGNTTCFMTNLTDILTSILDTANIS